MNVKCPVCATVLPIDFFECSKCGFQNPQLHLVRRSPVTVRLPDELMRTLEKMSTRSGNPIDDLVLQAVEYWITAVHQRKVKIQ